MIEVNGSIDALLNSPEVFFEVANDLSASLSKSLADDETQLTPVVKTLFDVVSLLCINLIGFTRFLLLMVMKVFFQFLKIFVTHKSHEFRF